MTEVIIIILVIFIRIPALIICPIVTLPDPKITALGGVATGSIKAQLAAKTTAKVRILGFTPMLIDNAAAIGKNVIVVAVFEVISVSKTIAKITTTKISNTGADDKNTRLSPIQSPKPELTIDDASERPPPNNNKSPQGNFLACSHTNNSVVLFSDGIMKKLTAAIIAIPGSVKPEKKLI